VRLMSSCVRGFAALVDEGSSRGSYLPAESVTVAIVFGERPRILPRCFAAGSIRRRASGVQPEVDTQMIAGGLIGASWPGNGALR